MAYASGASGVIQNGELSSAAGLAAAMSQQIKAEKEIGQNFPPVTLASSQAVEQQTVSVQTT